MRKAPYLVLLCTAITGMMCSEMKAQIINIKITDDVVDVNPYISSISITPLDDSILLSNIQKAIIDENSDIYVLHSGGRLLTITKNGKLGISYSKPGRASNEYLSIQDICLSKNYFSILDINKILSFKIGNPSTSRITSFFERKVPYEAIAPSGDDRFFLFSSYSADTHEEKKGNGELITLIDINSNMIKKFIPRADYSLSMFNITQSRNNSYYLKPQDSESVFYEFIDGDMAPSYRIDFGDKAIPARYYYNKAGEDIGAYMLSKYNKLPMELHDTKEYIYIRYCGQNAQDHSLVYNKKSKKCITWENDNADIDFRILCSDDDYFYMIPTVDSESHGTFASIINKKMKDGGCVIDQAAVVRLQFNF